VRTAIDMEPCRIEMGARWPQPQTCGRRGGNEAVEGRHPSLVQRLEGAPERVIIAMAGLHAWGNETREGFSLEKMGHEGALLVEKAQTVEDHGCDRMAGGHKTHFRVGLCRFINDLRDAECFKHPRDQTQMIEDLRAVRWRLWRDVRAVRVSHRLLLCRGDCIDPPKLLNDT